MPRTLDEVLLSISDVLFPADLGEKPLTIDSRNASGDTPLHVMAWRDDLEGVQILISAGADVNAVGDMGETPLHVAVTKKNLAIVEALLRAGARDDIRSEFEFLSTPLEMAMDAGGAIAELFKKRSDT